MRAIDKNRMIAMNELETRGSMLCALASEYKITYEKDYNSTQDKMDILDNIWKIITETNIRITEILRENGL